MSVGWILMGSLALTALAAVGLWAAQGIRVGRRHTTQGTGIMERWFAGQPEGRNVFFVAAFAPGSTPPSYPQLVEMVQALVDNHPSLAVRVNRREACVEPVTSLDIHAAAALVTRTDTDTWVDVATAEANHEFSDAPLFRVTCVQSPSDPSGAGFELVLAHHHVLGDGTTGITLLRTLVEAGRYVVGRGAPVPVLPWASPARAARIECHVDLRPTLGLICRELLQDRFPRLFPAKRAHIWHTGVVAPGCPTRSLRVAPFRLDARTLSTLLDAARARNTTVHAAVCAACAAAFADTFPAAMRLGEVTVTTPMDLRRRATPPLPPTTVGNCVSGAQGFVAEPRDPWGTAGRMGPWLRRHLPEAALRLGLLPFIDIPMDEWHVRNQARHRHHGTRGSTLEVSNLGRVSLFDDVNAHNLDTWQVQGVNWGQRGHAAMGGLMNIRVATVMGVMQGTVACGAQLCASAADLATFASRIESWLAMMAEQ